MQCNGANSNLLILNQRVIIRWETIILLFHPLHICAYPWNQLSFIILFNTAILKNLITCYCHHELSRFGLLRILNNFAKAFLNVLAVNLLQLKKSRRELRALVRNKRLS